VRKLGNGTHVLEKVQYDLNVVSKTVHLIRDPFDNLVSRFHLRCNKESRKKTRDWHARNESGFHDFCIDLDKTNMRKYPELFGKIVTPAAKVVPCHTDLFRYIQWHNYAFMLTRELQLPTKILHYEDYGLDFNSTISDVLSFLELRGQRKHSIQFHPGDYSAYFSNEQRKAAIEWIEILAFDETWKHLKKYYFS